MEIMTAESCSSQGKTEPMSKELETIELSRWESFQWNIIVNHMQPLWHWALPFTCNFVLQLHMTQLDTPNLMEFPQLQIIHHLLR
jgi:hypothetical protein